MPKNPCKTYKTTRKETLSGRELEAAVLEKAAINFRRCQQNWVEGQKFNKSLDEAIQFNNRLWNVFQNDWSNPNCSLPQDLKDNLLRLWVFIRKRSLDVLAYPEKDKLNVLIQINENLAHGLQQKVAEVALTTPVASEVNVT